MYNIKIIIIGVFIVFALSLSVFFVSGPNTKNILVEIPKNATAQSVASLLIKNNVISNRYFFLIALKLSGNSKSIIAGEFLFKNKISVAGVVKLVTSSKNLYYHKFVVLEGSTVADVINQLNNNTKLQGKITTKVKEGHLMPDTYYFSKDFNRNELLQIMQKSMQQYLDILWEHKNASLPYKNKEEALIMASLVEKESSYKDERRVIAGVFLNRLKIGMRLQTDPTVAYGLGKINAKNLTRADLAKKTPYNTYLIKGLPPTAIALPSKKSLDAVFSPQKTNYLYFVANGTGGHSFATNYKDHLKNVAKWRAFLKR